MNQLADINTGDCGHLRSPSYHGCYWKQNPITHYFPEVITGNIVTITSIVSIRTLHEAQDKYECLWTLVTNWNVVCETDTKYR